MSQGITKKALEDCVANTTEEPGLKSIFPANAEAKCCGPPLRAKPDCVEHYETIVGRSLRSKGAQKKARERKRGAVFAILRLESHSRLWELLGRMFAIVSIVIVIIPVALGAPTVAVFIPPAMVAGVAILACFVELTASLVGLTAVATMVFNGFMKTMIGPGNALLATIIGA